MTPTTKATIKRLLANESANASDELCRVKYKFKRLSVSEMEQEYAESELTRRHILGAAQRRADDVAATIKEFEAMP